MRRFINSKGAAYIPFLLVGGIIFGWALNEMKQHWYEAQKPAKEIHYKLVKQDRAKWWGREKVIFDVSMPCPIKNEAPPVAQE